MEGILGAVVLLGQLAAVAADGGQTSSRASDPPPSGGTAAVEELEPGEIFVNANNAYEDGDYPRAVELYQALLERDIDNGFLHYNLGNALLRNGELGRAIAAYRRSELHLPRFEDVRANLEFARRSTRDALEAPAPSALMRTLFFWHYGLSRAELLRLSVMLNVAFWGVLALVLVRRGSELLRWTAMLLLLLLLAAAGSYLVQTFNPERVAVIVPQEIDVHSGTGRDTVVRFKLHAGTEVVATQSRDGWLRIRLPDGEEGWIESQYAEVVVG